MAGRKPKPTALKLLKGTARPNRMNKKEPIPEIVTPDTKPPAWLSNEAKKEWKRLITLLTDNRIITDLDLSMLATLCQMWGEYIEGVKTGERVSMAHITQMRLIASEFGMTPSSRSRVEAITPETEAYDPWDDL